MPVTAPSYVYLVTPGREPDLIAEIPTGGRAATEAPGLVRISGAPAQRGFDPVFGRQVLPEPVAIAGPSVGTLAASAFAAVEATVDAWTGPWILHATVADPDSDPPLARRAVLVGQALAAAFKERRRRAHRRLRPWSELSARSWTAPGPDVLVVQVLLHRREHGLASAAPATPLPLGGTAPSFFPGGRAEVPVDRAPPSRAYRKLEEAFLWMGEAPSPGQRVADLGGAPGGWTWAALRRGAHVTAVDRAPLSAPVAGHPNLAARVADAFAFRPAEPVDWLLCDVIADAARTLDLVDRWLAERWFTRAVVTFKLRGRDHTVLGGLPALWIRHGVRAARVKHLAENHHEVTAMLAR